MHKRHYLEIKYRYFTYQNCQVKRIKLVTYITFERTKITFVFSLVLSTTKIIKTTNYVFHGKCYETEDVTLHLTCLL